MWILAIEKCSFDQDQVVHDTEKVILKQDLPGSFPYFFTNTVKTLRSQTARERMAKHSDSVFYLVV